MSAERSPGGGDLAGGLEAELRDELRAVARDLLTEKGPEAALDWRSVAEAGWLGLEAPEALNGADATFAEVAVVLEEMGRAAARGPYLGAIVLGAGVLGLLEPGPGRDRLLAATASGEVVPAVALPGDGAAGAAGGAAGEVPFRVEAGPGGPRLHGRAAFVPGAAEAGRLLLPALDPGGVPVIVDVAPDVAGLGRTAQPVLDATRGFGLVTADGVAVGEEAVWRFAGDPALALGRVRDRAAVAVACDSLGVSEAMLDATVAHAKVREQFGRPIGSFQAVQHACADMRVRISVARRLVEGAVRCLSGPPGGDDSATGVAAAMAKSYTCAAAVDVVGKAMQLHGGMGYTWESGVHVHLKRAMLNRSLFGSPAAHRARLAERYR
ncbi:acyl-CoA dehydrogenase [Actinomadura sp. LD22]|uniref:Acyl-CoA dehydrogenase n=1 Tax=Actinomadura physcomitrii TaxID=2650748 RepID=A0A6I4MHA3_9ACTN|nr:acyl-CoA dehydrogenase family protein [Actinomadura physcomitrii]MWA03524.1 acyl-CoA dehydrogenase [Actinomadura physcomitrii]